MIKKYEWKSKKGVSPAGLEPTAFGLRVRRSTIELRGLLLFTINEKLDINFKKSYLTWPI